MRPFSALPARQGLYDPANEHDSCGVAFVVDTSGAASRRIVDAGLSALGNLQHRGAAGSEPTSGDGAGILTQIPDRLLRETVDFELPPAGEYAIGIAFLPREESGRRTVVDLVADLAAQEGLRVLGWRGLPVDPIGADVGPTARGCMPYFSQLVVAPSLGRLDLLDLERRAFVLRKRIERAAAQVGRETYFASLSARTITYKGMLTTNQLRLFFPDLCDQRYESALALVHSRFSTNTFPSWPLAHPYRYIAHNGEINTIKGNRNRMHAREAQLASDLIPGDLDRIFPICTPEASDSATFDEVVELLHMGGRSLPHSVLMMIPEAWENHDEMAARRRAFYQFHATVMEPWDGPACVAFTDGTVIGAVLDRNGLRPGRWWHTADGLVVLASEVGVLDIPPGQVVAKGRLQPGRMFLVDTERGRIVTDDELKAELAAEHPYDEWVHAGLLRLPSLPAREHVVASHESVLRRQLLFGYTEEELRILLAPMASSGAEPIGSMGTDTPIAVLSARSRLLYDYFGQLFAQVTNPPLDAIREELVTCLSRSLGPEQNLLEPTAAASRKIVVPFPVIDNDELAKILHVNDDGNLPGFAAVRIFGHFDVHGDAVDGELGAGERALRTALDDVCDQVSRAIEQGARIIVLSDRDCDERSAPIPSLLLASAVHHHLIRAKSRMQVGLIVESGDCREVHHVALLLGYGAAAVNPYLAFETVEDMVADGTIVGVEPGVAVASYLKAL
ncbi:MAG: glutamate synthase central domain-containing protein, partial [Geodermatophilaceae bacterium]